jgi:hypothetical protein
MLSTTGSNQLLEGLRFRQWIKDLIDTDEVVFGQPSINVLRNKFFDLFNGIVIVWTNLTDSPNSQLH